MLHKLTHLVTSQMKDMGEVIVSILEVGSDKLVVYVGLTEDVLECVPVQTEGDLTLEVLNILEVDDLFAVEIQEDPPDRCKKNSLKLMRDNTYSILKQVILQKMKQEML